MNNINEIIYNFFTNAETKRTLVSLLYALLATALLAIVLKGVQYIFGRLRTTLKVLCSARLQPLTIRSFKILTKERLTETILAVVSLFRLISIFILFYLYIPIVLSLFPQTAELTPKLLHFISEPILNFATTIYNFLPNLLVIILTLFGTRYLLAFIHLFFSEIKKGSLKFDGFYQEWADPTYQLIRVLVLAFMLVIVVPYLPGAESPAFRGVSVFLGVLFSFGSSSAVSNIIAGIVLTYMRPFKEGDRVKISDTVGDVIEKSLLVTRVRTIKNVDVTIPNGMILNSHMTNYSSSAQSHGLVLNTSVTIGYDTPWRLVHELLQKAAARTPNTLQTPKPFVLQTALNDFAVSYELNVYTNEPNQMALTYSLLHGHIQDSFAEANVEIMSPNYFAIRKSETSTVPKSST